MGEGRHTGDKSKTGDQSGATQPAEESHVHKGLFGGLADLGNTVLHKTQDVAHDVSEGYKKNAPKVLKAAKEAAASPAGQKVQSIGRDVVNDEKNRGVELYGAAKKGDVLKVVKEAPFALSPHALILNEAVHIAGKQIVKNTPAEHQGTVNQVIGVKDVIGGHGFPSAKGLIVDGITHPETQKQALSMGKQAADGVSNLWHKATSHGDERDKQKAEDIEAEKVYAAKHPHTGKQ